MDYLLILLGLVVLGVALAALTRGHLWWARTLQREHASEHDTLQAVTAEATPNRRHRFPFGAHPDGNGATMLIQCAAVSSWLRRGRLP